MAKKALTAQTIITYRVELGMDCEETSNLQWVCDLINSLSINERALSKEQLNAINKRIKSIPTGKQRVLLNALDHVLFYLKEICNWQLPEVKEQAFTDDSMIWLLNIHKKNLRASQCFSRYESQRESFIVKRWHDLGWVLLVLNFEVAPLHLSYWQRILSTPTCIEFFEGQFTLKVSHPKPIASYADESNTSFTRYPLPAFPLRVLQNFYNYLPEKALTTKSLLDAINRWVDTEPYYFAAMSPAEWLRTFQSFWHHHYAVPPKLLRDLSDPMRHVSPLESTKPHTIDRAKEKLLFIPPMNKAVAGAVKKALADAWPHTKLIKYYKLSSQKNVMRPTAPTWDHDNVIPKLFFHFTDELFNEGGVHKKTLLSQSIDRYTNFYKSLNPLSFDDATNPETLHCWAHKEFERLDEKTTPWHLYNFLRSAAHQELTDELDLEQFERPEQPSLVDPFCLNVSQINSTVELLLSSKNGHAMQRLCASIAVILGYYGAMRRGEVLRLCLGDITSINPQKKQLFSIVIRNTPEGTTKNKKPRIITVFMPEPAAKLIQKLLEIKTGCDETKPLLAFEHESIGLRSTYYIYPVTQALKALFGHKVRFHHLRHGGAELLYLQGLHLAYQRQGCHLSNTLQDEATEAMLSKESCLARFDFWLEGRPFDGMNTGLLLDTIAKELGHSSYATTRRHYLHGMEKTITLLKPAYRQYSRAELRYIFDIPADSNDISRILNSLSQEYSLLSSEDKKQFQPELTESQIIKKLKLNTLMGGNVTTTNKQPSTFNKCDFKTLWKSSLPEDFIDKNTNTFNYFCKKVFEALNNKTLDFKTANIQWRQLAKGQYFNFASKELKALKTLGKPKIILQKPQGKSHTETLNIQFSCVCNQKTLQAFKALCHKGPLKHYTATFLLIQNRKSLNSNKLNMVKNQFLRKDDNFNWHKTPGGNTQLIITLKTLIPSTLLAQTLEQYFLNITLK
ncbi:site-specific integrase [Pseudoalteromonas sp. SWN166]|uniref:site-specific integrase n=1 Tax=Pseudoalteromonas sp. SWN166 TaxID=2792061 RepID=UPI0018CE29DA|nr:site-specific integrase [Pseudoalteromonas sp. SWN166]MBH0038970.1 site-specific integrase [Pseudoalteromonas sp. SWN166]